VSIASVQKYVASQQADRSLAPGKSPGRREAIPPEQYRALVRQLTKHPDVTLAEHVAWWEATYRVALSTMYRTIRRLRGTYRKDMGS
jgi:transposase